MTREEALNNVRQMSLPKETMEILEALAPELAESEDERIRKEIIKFIQDFCNPCDPDCDKWIAYLEKQKDSVSNNFDDVWNEEDCEEIIAEGQKLTPKFKELLKEVCHAWYDRGAKLEKQKEASKAIEAVERIDKYIDEHLANAHDMKNSNPDKKYYRGWDDALGEMARILQDVYSGEKQKEQKVSVDDFKAKDWYVSKVDGKIHNIYYSVDKVKPKFKVGDKIIEKDFDECGRGTIIDIKDGKYIFDDGGFICIEEQGLWKLVEQKPAEWSEEDEEMLKDIISGLKAQKLLIFAHENQGKAQMNARIDWLQSLPERFNLQPKPEWGEEDEKMLQSIIKDFRAGKVSTIGQERWLKSLRPQYHGDVTMTEAYKMGKEAGEASHWKPTEKEITALENLMKGEFPNKIYPGTTLSELLVKLKKLYYNESIPSWKPSEEQMKALYDACCIAFEEERDFHPSLSRLYHDLMKL